MSQKRTLRTIAALLQDPDLGLAAHLRAIAEREGYEDGRLRTGFHFGRYGQADIGLTPAGQQATLFIVPGTWEEEEAQHGSTQRDGTCEVRFSADYIGADPDELEDNVMECGAALRRALDGLCEYSRDRGLVTVIELASPLRIVPAPLEGGTGFGFDGTITLKVRSPV